MIRKVLFGLIIVLVVVASFIGFKAYHALYEPNVKEDFVLWIDNQTDLSDILVEHGKHFSNLQHFETIGNYKGLAENLKIGRYEIEQGMTANQVVNQLLAGRQSPFSVTINFVRDLEDLSKLLGQELYPSQQEFLEYFQSSELLEKYQLKNSEVLGLFIPNTYEFYWTTSPAAFAERMAKEREKFWANRQEKLERSPLNQAEVLSLASIVESETARFDEMPVVAGLYLNRLEQGILLQSDPTVIYAWQQEHPEDQIIRVLYKHLKIVSPYNTYLNKGLPPGPIRIVSPQAIDAVLNAQDHAYIFMCADPRRPGYHAFTSSLREHNINRQRYTNWLREQQRIARSRNS